MSEPTKPTRYACKVVAESDGIHAFVELVEDASGEYVRPCDLGFTREDVSWLRQMSFSTMDRTEAEAHQQWWQSFLARVEDLLPPEKK